MLLTACLSICTSYTTQSVSDPWFDKIELAYLMSRTTYPYTDSTKRPKRDLPYSGYSTLRSRDGISARLSQSSYPWTSRFAVSSTSPLANHLLGNMDFVFSLVCCSI
ncbi:uncharacterized protein CLUP02_16575 [Colletotrichum lupini]|uniref:Uncharacterized protein n=1 Tax=Colletotrichum lupini TaxID=145971 RepID=A0A9Q8WPS8_9PEZI|nr:uncharacterized protein CLUP02_16575 [Colletotrichum lupini]UQC91041.1 hypothetical protein CLUP02_16575 [Colletotrichum lupini]